MISRNEGVDDPMDSDPNPNPHRVQYAKYQRPSTLITELSAQVNDIWLDNRGSGNERRDFYWHISLFVCGWPITSSYLLARSQIALERGTFYDIKGESFLNSGTGWKKSFILISSATKIDGNGHLKPPAFSLLAQVKLVSYNQCLLYWCAWDDYEQATYDQIAVVNCGHDIKGLLNKKCLFRGEMQSGDHENDWTCGSVETFSL